MKRVLLITCAFFSPCLNASGTCEENIRDFYVNYMKALDRGESADSINSLLNSTFTPELLAALDEYIEETDVDPILRAQDVNTYGIESLTVSPLDADGWYMVKYFWDSHSDYIEIPLKASCSNNNLKVTYITPLWLGTQYGDHLLPSH